MFFQIGVIGFEPTTLAPQTRYATSALHSENDKQVWYAIVKLVRFLYWSPTISSWNILLRLTTVLTYYTQDVTFLPDIASVVLRTARVT